MLQPSRALLLLLAGGVAVMAAAPVKVPSVRLAWVSTVDGLVTFSTDGTRADESTMLKQWELRFGDGQSASGAGAPLPQPIHIYPAPGTYTARLAVWDARGLTDDAEAVVVIAAPSVPSPTGDGNAHFEALRALPSHYRSWSLRSQSELDGLVNAPPSTFFTYDPVFDAAKMQKNPDASGTESVPGKQTLRLPLGGFTDGSCVFTWDTYWGQDWQDNRGTLDGEKSFFFFLAGGKSYWVLRDTFGSKASPHQRMPLGAAGRHFDTLDPLNAPDAPGVTRADGSPGGSGDPYNPTGLGAAPLRTFWTMEEVWTRYVAEVRLSIPGAEFTEWSAHALGGAPLTGTWDMVSLWIGDENRDLVPVLFRVPVTPRVSATVTTPLGFSNFRFAFNTSTQAPAITGPLVAYVRNAVLLRNHAPLDGTDPLIFQRPVR